MYERAEADNRGDKSRYAGEDPWQRRPKGEEAPAAALVALLG
jgi:hypothetical protein